MNIPALVGFSVVEGYFLQHSLFADSTFRTVVLGALAVNLLVTGIYNFLIYPLFLNPLRHLPTIPVSTTSSSKIA